MDGNFIWDKAIDIAHARLLIEGALFIYEHDMRPLHNLAIDNDELIAASALENIGVALAQLHQQIYNFQQEHMQESGRQLRRNNDA